MSKVPDEYSEAPDESAPLRTRGEQKFKKLIRPLHATRRATAPARMRGIHRRRRRRMGW